MTLSKPESTHNAGANSALCRAGFMAKNKGRHEIVSTAFVTKQLPPFHIHALVHAPVSPLMGHGTPQIGHSYFWKAFQSPI